MADTSSNSMQESPENQNNENLAIDEKSDEVEDKFHLVYLIIVLLGIGVLMPWNMLLNISFDYFESYKLKENVNGTLQDTTYSSVFQNVMTVASQLPNLLLNLVNIFRGSGGDLARRIKFCMLINGSVIFLTLVLSLFDTSSYIGAFFVVTILTVILLEGSNGTLQNCLFGMVSELPFTYTNAIIIGTNFCGTFVTLLAMMTKYVTDSIIVRAALYFGLSVLTILTCYIALEIMIRRKFFKYHVAKAREIKLRALSAVKTTDDLDVGSLGFYIGVFKEAKMQLFNVFYVMFVTLAIFPNVKMYVLDNKPGEEYSFLVPEKYFMDVTTFLNFNVFAFIGSLIANYVQVPSPKYMWIPVLARTWFIFYFPFANYLPETRKWPVLFESTWFFVFNGFLNAITSGYLCSLCMMYAPRTVAPQRARFAAMMACFFLILGVVGGIIFSIFIKLFVTQWGPGTITSL